jgi:hypothetical protein
MNPLTTQLLHLSLTNFELVVGFELEVRRPLSLDRCKVHRSYK